MRMNVNDAYGLDLWPHLGAPPGHPELLNIIVYLDLQVVGRVSEFDTDEGWVETFEHDGSILRRYGRVAPHVVTY
jgi:hypothetical protein